MEGCDCGMNDLMGQLVWGWPIWLGSILAVVLITVTDSLLIGIVVGVVSTLLLEFLRIAGKRSAEQDRHGSNENGDLT